MISDLQNSNTNLNNDLSKRLNALKTENMAQKKQIETQAKEILDKTAEITKLRQSGTENQTEIEKLTAKLQEKTDTIELTCANNAGFNIHCFVRAQMDEDTELEQHIGKRAYLCGKLADFSVSEDNVYSWISDLTLSEGFIRILEDEFEKLDE